MHNYHSFALIKTKLIIQMSEQREEQLIIHELAERKKMSISDFRRGEVLGTGTFSHVQQVFYHDIPFALKVMSIRKMVELKQTEHVRWEREVLQELNHPFIIRMHRCFHDSTNLYMLLEYVQGGELFSRLRKLKRFSLSQTLFYASQVLLSVEHMHQMDVIYRDLKPENILIDKEGYIKVVDFGFAKKVKHSRTYTLCGTPDYLAPELIRGEQYGKSVDIWSFGILIYEMMVGHPPFISSKPLLTYRKILSADVRYPSHLSSSCRDVLQRLLNPSSRDRICCSAGNMEELKQHPFFASVSFRRVLSREEESPWKPSLMTDSDTQHYQDGEKCVEKAEKCVNR